MRVFLLCLLLPALLSCRLAGRIAAPVFQTTEALVAALPDPGLNVCGCDAPVLGEFTGATLARMAKAMRIPSEQEMLGALSVLPPRIVRVGLVVDSRYRTSWTEEELRAEAEAHWISVTDLYDEEIGYVLEVQVDTVFRGEDPWEDVPPKWNSLSFDYTVLLNAFRDWVQESDNLYSRGEVDCMMFHTGRYPSVAGAAYATTICHSQLNACGLVFGMNPFVSAHELAHMLGVGHDTKDDKNEAGQGYIMAKSVGGAQLFSFSERSKSHFLQQAYIFSCLEEPPTEDGPPFLRGDIKFDGKIDLQDAVALSNYLFPPNEESRFPCNCDDAADVNDSGALGVDDILYLMNHLTVPAWPPIPPPQGFNGPDPTPDGLGCNR